LLDRGCVQGSILGPKLFNLYLRELARLQNQSTTIVTYADDTYVLVRGLPGEIVRKTEETIAYHIELLERYGMCVNESKTEVMYIGPETKIKSISISNKDLPLVSKIKALGITVSTPCCGKIMLLIPSVKAKRCWVH